MSVQLPSWLFDLFDSSTLHDSSYYMWVSLTSTLHTLIYNSTTHSSDAAKMTHDMTWHDSFSMFMLLVVSMSSCNSAELWMCYWCIIASPLHGKVCRVFDGLGVHLMLHVHISRLLILWHASYVLPFTKKYPHMHHPFANKSPRMHRPFAKKYPFMHHMF